jgi:segregation and condensation protein A
VPVHQWWILREAKAGDRFEPQAPEGSALGVNIVIFRGFKPCAQRPHRAKDAVYGWTLVMERRTDTAHSMAHIMSNSCIDGRMEQEEYIVEKSYQVHVEDIFDGPMELLVHLVKKHELDIYDIPIAMITKQYMEYLSMMKALNIDVAGNFLVLAATLAHIKSQMMLPVSEEGDEEEDPRLEIVRPLEEFLRLKSAADDLMERHKLGWDVFTRESNELEEVPDEPPEGFVRVSLFDLIDAFQRIVKRVSSESFMNITVDTISVKSRIAEIVDMMEGKESVSFDDFFSDQRTKGQVVVTFLAILEMAKSQIIRIMQHVESGVIRIFHG